MEEQPEDSSPVVALVDDSGKMIITDSTTLKVVKINSINCDLVTLTNLALVDPRSPISFISPTSFNKLFDPTTILQKDSKQLYKALNDIAIATHGSIISNILIQLIQLIQLEFLPDLTAPINLHVLKNNFTSADLIIDRDFLSDNEINYYQSR